MTKTFLKLCVLSGLAIAPAYSYAQDDPNVAAINNLSNQTEKLWMDVFKEFADIEKIGERTIEKQDSYYAVTSPHYSLNFKDGSKFDIGIIASNIVPHTQEGQWKLAQALPTPMSFIDQNGQATVRVDIGGQRSACLYDDNLGGYCAKLDQSLSNVRIQDLDKNVSVIMGEIRAANILEKTNKGENTWSGPSYIKLNDFSLESAGQSFFKLSSLNTTFKMFDVDLKATQEASKTFEQFAMNAENSQLGQSPEQASKMMSDLQVAFDQLLQGYGNGFTSEFEISGLSFTDPKNAGPVSSIALEKANMGFDMVGFLDNNVSFDLRLGYDGIDVQPIPEEFNKLTPTNFNFDASVQQIPFNDIYAMMKEGMANANDPSAMQMMGMGLLFRLPGLLSEKGTKLVLDNNYIGNDNYMIKIKGEALADVSAMRTATANANITISGFDFLMSNAQSEIQNNPTGAQAGNLQQMIMGLQMIQGFADVQKDENGSSLHVFNISLDKQGKIMVNGRDLSMLAGGAPPAGLPQ